MLPVEGQMVAELVDENAGQQAHVGQAALKHRWRCRRAAELARVLALDHRPPVEEHHVGAGALGQTVGFFHADDRVAVGLQRRHLGIGHLDHFDGNRRIEAKITVGALGVALSPPYMAGDGCRWLRGCLRNCDRLAQAQLGGILAEDAALALAPEQLLLEPVDLALEIIDEGGQLRVIGLRLLPRFQQGDDLVSAHRRSLLVQGHALFLHHLTPCAKCDPVQDQTKALGIELAREI